MKENPEYLMRTVFLSYVFGLPALFGLAAQSWSLYLAVVALAWLIMGLLIAMVGCFAAQLRFIAILKIVSLWPLAMIVGSGEWLSE